MFTKQDPSTGFAVNVRHYEQLRNALDTNEKGWVELDSSFGDGKVFLLIEDIITLVNSTESYVEELSADAVVDG